MQIYQKRINTKLKTLRGTDDKNYWLSFTPLSNEYGEV